MIFAMKLGLFLNKMIENPTQLKSRFLRISRLLRAVVVHPRAPEAIGKTSSPLPIIGECPGEVTSDIYATSHSISYSAHISFEKVLTECVVEPET